MQAGTFTMKLKEKREWGPIEGNRGVTFTFRDMDFTHQESLSLERAGEPVPGVHHAPLYGAQAIMEGEMCELEFEFAQTRDQIRVDGRRDSVKDRIGLQLSAVRPAEAPQTRNGQRESTRASA